MSIAPKATAAMTITFLLFISHHLKRIHDKDIFQCADYIAFKYIISNHLRVVKQKKPEDEKTYSLNDLFDHNALDGKPFYAAGLHTFTVIINKDQHEIVGLRKSIVYQIMIRFTWTKQFAFFSVIKINVLIHKYSYGQTKFYFPKMLF